nr:DEC-1 protein, N-terminal region protein [uncultured bacterium]
MTYQQITRNQVDRAAPLDFAERTPRQELTITVKARVNGFDVDICFSGHIEQLDAMTKRLAELGIAPVVAPSVAAAAAPVRKAAKRLDPAYTDAGEACCPVHHKPLVEGRYGLYCPSRATGDQAANDKGYCSIRFTD